MRPWAPALVLAVLLAPLASAQDEAFTLAPGTYRSFPFDLAHGDRLDVLLLANASVDLLLVAGPDDAYYARNSTVTPHAQHLDASEANLTLDIPASGRWSLIVDNTARPDGGANGTANATVRLDLVVRRVVVPDPVVDPDGPTDASPSGSRDPWPVLMFTAPHWDLGLVGLGSVALWTLLFAAWAAFGYREGLSKVLVLTVGLGALVALWSFLPRPGPISAIGIPLLFAAGIAWMAVKGTSDMRQAVRLAWLAAVLGVVLGVVLGHLVSLAWSDPGLLVVGGERFWDPLFLIPLMALFLVLMLTVIPAFVDAFEEDEPASMAAAPGLGATFDVVCLRCGTSIKVDRSMRRFRVATDRYEFACPNCQAWMEWAEPKPQT